MTNGGCTKNHSKLRSSFVGRALPRLGSREDRMVMNLDFAETFLDIAGVEIPSDMQGASMVPILQGKETPRLAYVGLLSLLRISRRFIWLTNITASAINDIN